MAWLAVDDDGTEIICSDKLIRLKDCWINDSYNNGLNPYYADSTCELPKGSIEKLIGKTLTWEDEPFEYK